MPPHPAMPRNQDHSLYVPVAGDSLMRLAEDLFLLFKSVARGAFPPFFDIIAQNIPYHSTKLFVIRTIPSLVHYCDLVNPLLACFPIERKI